MPEKRFTDKEEKVIQAFESARPGLGEIAKANIIQNDSTGWADIIADMEESDTQVRDGFASNTFMYRRIGG